MRAGPCEARTDVCTGRAQHMHHRKLRSQGGKDEASNYLSCCSSCHGFIHARPAWSYERGLLVRSYQDPAEVPVTREVRSEVL